MNHKNAVIAADNLYLATRSIPLNADQHELLKRSHDELVRHLESTNTELLQLRAVGEKTAPHPEGPKS